MVYLLLTEQIIVGEVLNNNIPSEKSFIVK